MLLKGSGSDLMFSIIFLFTDQKSMKLPAKKGKMVQALWSQAEAPIYRQQICRGSMYRQQCTHGRT